MELKDGIIWSVLAIAAAFSIGFICIGIAQVYVAASMSVHALNESDICWLELYDTSRTSFGMSVPLYNDTVFFRIFNQTENMRSDCQLLYEICERNVERFGCVWLEKDRICECDIRRVTDETVKEAEISF